MLFSLPSLRSGFQPSRYLGMSWSSHLSFAYDLIAELNPKVFVELGTHLGESYFSFCQSVKENKLKTHCFAIDHFKGDIFTGYYDQNVLKEVEFANRNYAAFSRLIQSSFEQARAGFPDGSIDLLHIDGMHDYDSVRRDFETWLPKMSPSGMILFHDIAVIKKGFGVLQFWQELKRQFKTFEFEHGYGLGILKINPAQTFESPFIEELLSGHEAQAQTIRQYYIRCHERIAYYHSEHRQNRDKPNSSVQIAGRAENLAFSNSISEKINQQIYHNGKKIKLDIILQTHTESNSQGKLRYCGTPKREVSRRCAISLVQTLNACGPHIDAELIVLDDHSSQEGLTELKSIFSQSKCRHQVFSLEERGIMNSIYSCYEWGLKNSRQELVYFAQDDYLYDPTAIEEMVDSYYRFEYMLGNQAIGIFPYDDPHRYYAPGNVENTRIVQGLKRHWRWSFFTPSTFMVHHSLIQKKWTLFEAMGRAEVGPTMEDDTINKIWQEGGVTLFTPIPSLALHLQYETEKDPYIDWKRWWDRAITL